MLVSKPSSSDSSGCLLITTAYSKHQHWFTDFSTVVPLASLDHRCLCAVASTSPGVVTLTINMSFQSTMNFLTMYAVQHPLPPSGKSSNFSCLQKPIHHNLPVTAVSSLVWPGYVIWTHDRSPCLYSAAPQSLSFDGD